MVSYNSSVEKSSLAKFHLCQSLGIMVTGFALWIVVWMLIFIMPFFVFFIWFLWIFILVLWILGLVSAVNGEEKPVIALGPLYQKMFTFIN